jgi:hypothetical protein
VWQAKDLRKGISRSVAMIGLTSWFFGSVARKGVKEVTSGEWRVNKKGNDGAES